MCIRPCADQQVLEITELKISSDEGFKFCYFGKGIVREVAKHSFPCPGDPLQIERPQFSQSSQQILQEIEFYNPSYPFVSRSRPRGRPRRSSLRQ